MFPLVPTAMFLLVPTATLLLVQPSRRTSRPAEALPVLRPISLLRLRPGRHMTGTIAVKCLGSYVGELQHR
eukprot:147727-Chlamydomonas_euryale.AAC.3